MRTTAVALVCLLFSTSNAFAQAFVDVNYIAARSNQGDQTYSIALPTAFFSNRTIVESIPAFHSAGGVDVDGGFTIARGIGAAIRWGYVKHGYPIEAKFTSSNPIAVPSQVSDTDVTDEVHRKDFALDLMANYVVNVGHNVRLRGFAGPTYFSVAQDMLKSVALGENFGPSIVHTVDISNLTTTSFHSTAWGYNLGGDVSYFFSRHVGVGAGVHYNHGRVTDVDIRLPSVGAIGQPPMFLQLDGPPADLSVGHTVLAVGVRLRY